VSIEPADKRTIAFFDGQNLFHAARAAFGYTFPNYDPIALATALCKQRGWNLAEVRFYTGVPDAGDDPFWNHFWTSKLAQTGRRGAKVYSRSLVYRNKVHRLPDGTQTAFLKAEEKGIDVRIAIDVISFAWRNLFDVALVFSQDQDLSEAAREIRDVAQRQDRWIKIASAFPVSPASTNRKGIHFTDWLPIDRTTYDSCLDGRDYRPKNPSTTAP
jgi:uncharacterized LabA/DUF88 family protein